MIIFIIIYIELWNIWFLLQIYKKKSLFIWTDLLGFKTHKSNMSILIIFKTFYSRLSSNRAYRITFMYMRLKIQILWIHFLFDSHYWNIIEIVSILLIISITDLSVTPSVDIEIKQSWNLNILIVINYMNLEMLSR